MQEKFASAVNQRLGWIALEPVSKPSPHLSVFCSKGFAPTAPPSNFEEFHRWRQSQHDAGEGAPKHFCDRCAFLRFQCASFYRAVVTRVKNQRTSVIALKIGADIERKTGNSNYALLFGASMQLTWFLFFQFEKAPAPT